MREQIAEIFQKTADNEKEHAKLWLKALSGIGTTAENLKAAAEGENYEWTDMYDTFAKKQRRRALQSLPTSSERLLQSKKRMRRDTALCSTMLTCRLFSKNQRRRCGSAATAVTL